MAGENWTDPENDLIIADYFAMLKVDLAGQTGKLNIIGSFSAAS